MRRAHNDLSYRVTRGVALQDQMATVVRSAFTTIVHDLNRRNDRRFRRREFEQRAPGPRSSSTRDRNHSHQVRIAMRPVKANKISTTRLREREVSATVTWLQLLFRWLLFADSVPSLSKSGHALPAPARTYRRADAGAVATGAQRRARRASSLDVGALS